MKKKLLLTESQKSVLVFIKAFINQRKYAPSIREIAKGMRYNAHQTAHKHLIALEDKGYISRVSGIPRSIRLIDFH